MSAIAAGIVAHLVLPVFPLTWGILLYAAVSRSGAATWVRIAAGLVALGLLLALVLR